MNLLRFTLIMCFALLLITNITVAFGSARDQLNECDSLSEKVDIFLKLQQDVNKDFASISDSQLCSAMSDQCEHFYRQAIENQKFYKDHCDADYEMVEVAKCAYQDNPCNKPMKKKQFNKGLHHTPQSNKPQIVLDLVVHKNAVTPSRW